jgi:hypothetical protein
MTTDRIAGAILVIMGLLGFLTVADDLRHVGEIVGASGIVLAGCLLLAASLKPIAIPSRIARSGAIGIFGGMVIGAGLDNMVVGVGIGLSAGIVAGLLLERRTTHSKDRSP